MNKTIYILLCAAMVSACESSTEQTTTEKTDSMSLAAVPMDPALEKLIANFTLDKELMYVIDAQKMDDLIPGKELKAADVKLLMQNPLKDELFGSTAYTIKEFMQIDSVKALGKYEEWSAGLDVGATIDSHVYAYSKARTGVNSWALFWIHEHRTMEACPYSYGKTVYVTAISNNKIGETIVFAEQSGASDAPVSFDRKLSGTMLDSAHLALSVVEEQDDDEPTLERTEALYEISLKDGNFSFTSRKKEAPYKVEKKKAE
jgi:hypothetical protein